MYDSFIWYSYIFIYYCESMHLFYRHVYCLPYRAEGVEIKLLDVICVKTSGSHGPLIFFTHFMEWVYINHIIIFYIENYYYFCISNQHIILLYMGGGHASTHIFFYKKPSFRWALSFLSKLTILSPKGFLLVSYLIFFFLRNILLTPFTKNTILKTNSYFFFTQI